MAIKRAEIPVPRKIQETLTMTAKGYFKPWFVQDEDFRVMDPKKWMRAMKEKRCFICGLRITGEVMHMVHGPKSATNCCVSEPGGHRECMEYALQVCPYILYPNAKRREAGMPEGTNEGPNSNPLAELGNPGVYFITGAKRYMIHDSGHGYPLIGWNDNEVVYQARWVEGEKILERDGPLEWKEVWEGAQYPH